MVNKLDYSCNESTTYVFNDEDKLSTYFIIL